MSDEYRGGRGNAAKAEDKRPSAKLEVVTAALGMALALIGIQKAFDATLAERSARAGQPSESMFFYQPLTPEKIAEFKQGAPGTSDLANFDVGTGFGGALFGAAAAAAALERRRRRRFGVPENPSQTS